MSLLCSGGQRRKARRHHGGGGCRPRRPPTGCVPTSACQNPTPHRPSSDSEPAPATTPAQRSSAVFVHTERGHAVRRVLWALPVAAVVCGLGGAQLAGAQAAPSTVTLDPGPLGRPQLGVAADGGAIVAWPTYSGGSVPSILASVRSAGGAFGRPRRLSTAEAARSSRWPSARAATRRSSGARSPARDAPDSSSAAPAPDPVSVHRSRCLRRRGGGRQRAGPARASQPGWHCPANAPLRPAPCGCRYSGRNPARERSVPLRARYGCAMSPRCPLLDLLGGKGP